MPRSCSIAIHGSGLEDLYPRLFSWSDTFISHVLWTIGIGISCLTTTVQVSEKTLQLLNKLKEEIGVRSLDHVIMDLISERKKIPRSMFGSNPKLRPFTAREEAESHEL